MRYYTLNNWTTYFSLFIFVLKWWVLPKSVTYFNKTVKYSIKVVSSYIVPCQLTEPGYTTSHPCKDKYSCKGSVVARVETSCTYKVSATVIVICATLKRIKDPRDHHDQDWIKIALYIVVSVTPCFVHHVVTTRWYNIFY